MKGLERLTTFSSRRANVQKTGFGDRSILWYNFLGATLKIEYFRIRIRVEVNPYVGEIFTRIFLFPIGKEMCLCRKNENLILCSWRCAFTPFRSVIVFISDFFAPFLKNIHKGNC